MIWAGGVLWAHVMTQTLGWRMVERDGRERRCKEEYKIDFFPFEYIAPRVSPGLAVHFYVPPTLGCGVNG